MDNTFDSHQIVIDNYLQKNKYEDAINDIFNWLKGEFKNEINLKLLALNNLTFIADQFCVKNNNLGLALKGVSKSKKLIDEVKRLNHPQLELSLLKEEASYNLAMFNINFKKTKSLKLSLKYNLQKAISLYWKAINRSTKEKEKYAIRNNLANCLSRAGRYIEAIELFETNIKSNPNNYQSFISWGHTIENLFHKAYIDTPDSFVLVLIERYNRGFETCPNPHIRNSIEKDITRNIKILLERNIEFSIEMITKNRYEELKEFGSHTEYRKFVLLKNISLNEHALFCKCKKTAIDNLSIGLQSGSDHLENLRILETSEKYIEQIKSEYAFARMLYFKYFSFAKKSENKKLYNAKDYVISSLTENNSLLGYQFEHIKTSFKILYSILDKIATCILLKFDINQKDKDVYFENFFGDYKEYLESDNIHLIAIYSISLDLCRNEGEQVGSLKHYKDIRNLMEHDLLILSDLKTNIEKHEININHFEDMLLEVLILTKSTIFSLVHFFRSESIIL